MDPARAKEIVSSLYEDWYSSLLAYVYRLTGKPADAEEIVQEAFMLLYRRCRKGHGIQNPQGWTLRVARRLAWKRRTRETCWPLTDLAISRTPTSEPNPEQRLLQSQFTLEQFLDELTPREAEVVLLRLSGLKYREIAATLKVGSSSVNTLLSRALTKMRTAAGERAGRFPATSSLEGAHS